MDKTAFEVLIKDLAPSERLKGSALFNGVVSGISEYQKKKTAANLNNWQAAEKALNEFIDSISTTPVNEKTFKGIPAVVKYLHDQGWKISERTAYNHKDKRLLLPRKDGKYYQTDLDRYVAGGNIQRIDGINGPGNQDNLTDEKQRAETRKAVAQAEHWELKTQISRGFYVPRDAFERELAQRAMIFKSDAEAFCRAQASVIIGLVSGDKEQAPDLTEYMLGAVAGWLSRYAADREFTVPLADHEEIMADPDDELDVDNEDDAGLVI